MTFPLASSIVCQQHVGAASDTRIRLRVRMQPARESRRALFICSQRFAHVHFPLLRSSVETRFARMITYDPANPTSPQLFWLLCQLQQHCLFQKIIKPLLGRLFQGPPANLTCLLTAILTCSTGIFFILYQDLFLLTALAFFICESITFVAKFVSHFFVKYNLFKFIFLKYAL
jgi:hypothetical protein